MIKGTRSVLGLAFVAVVGVIGVIVYEGKPLELPIEVQKSPFVNSMPR